MNVAAVIPKDIKTILSNGLSILPIKSNPVFSNGPKGLLKNPSDCPILCNRVFLSNCGLDNSASKVLYFINITLKQKECGRRSTVKDLSYSS